MRLRRTARVHLPSPGPLTLRAEQVGISFDGVVLARGLNLVVEPGQLHVLFGRSGSGKTSILRAFAGLTPPTDGAITWTSTNSRGATAVSSTTTEISRAGPEDRATLRRDLLGYADQASSVLEELTAQENVLLPAVPDGLTPRVRRRACALLESLALAERASSPAGVLSQGERQRVCLARGLLKEPPLLIADEPTASLDRALADEVLEVLRGYADAGRTVVVASHDPALMAAADTATEIEPGRGQPQ